MHLNADFDRRAVAHAAALDWVSSPMAGVHRRMLDRVGAEVARATSIVRYAPGSHFSPHIHDGGEEFLVLDGVFQDEYGDYKPGTYIRNPPTSRHTPGSDNGCIIFVKLWQFDPADRTPVTIDTASGLYAPVPNRPGVEALPLFQDASEEVRLERWAPDMALGLSAPGGIEVLVLEGSFTESGETFDALSWLRVPSGGTLSASTGSNGCRIWVKSGHLKGISAALARLP